MNLTIATLAPLTCR